MSKKSLLKMIGLSFLIVCLCVIVTCYFYYLLRIKADDELCQQLLAEPKHQDFFEFIDQRSEKRGTAALIWKQMERRDEFLHLDMAKKIANNSKYYLSDALKVIISPDYDENQKMYAIFLMRYLPVKHYMCVMDASNMAYEQGIIKDKEVLRTALSPDSYRGIISYFWWLADWQKRFKKHADQLYSKEYIEDILKGRQAYLFPPKA